MNKFKALFFFGLVPILAVVGMIFAMTFAYLTRDHKSTAFEKEPQVKEVIKTVEVEKIVRDTVYIKVPCNKQHTEIKPKKDTI